MSYSPIAQPHQRRTQRATPQIITAEQIEAIKLLPEKMKTLDTVSDQANELAVTVQRMSEAIAILQKQEQARSEALGKSREDLSQLMAKVERLNSNSDLWNTIEKSVVIQEKKKAHPPLTVDQEKVHVEPQNKAKKVNTSMRKKVS